jgi:hypothetical protein
MTGATRHIGPEFSRPIEVARVANTGSHEKIMADARECAALAKRLKLPTVMSVAAHLVVTPWSGGGYKVTGEVVAEFDQESVVSLEVFRTQATFPVERYFLKKARDLDEDEADADVIEGGVIDLGEVAAETIGLELDPYPRKPGEAFAGHEEETTAKVTPFAVLKKT